MAKSASSNISIPVKSYWIDNDPRMKGRTVEVLSVDKTHVYYVNVTGKKIKTQSAIARFLKAFSPQDTYNTGPAPEQRVALIEKPANPLIEQARSLAIASPADMETATDVLSKLNKTLKAADAAKQEVLTPLNAARTAELKRWKPLETVIEGAIADIRGKMTKYQTAQVAAAKEEEGKIADKATAGRLRPDTAAKKMAEVARPAEAVGSAQGVVKFRPHEVVDITPLRDIDFSQYPVEQIAGSLVAWAREGLIEWNEVAVRKLILDKKDDRLPGVTYRVEQRPVNTTS